MPQGGVVAHTLYLWREEVLESDTGAGQCHSSSEEDDENHVREYSGEVDHLEMIRICKCNLRSKYARKVGNIVTFEI